MHALKSSLLILSAVAFLGCPKTAVPPEPEPEPGPQPGLPAEQGPCAPAGQGLTAAQRHAQWGPPTFSTSRLLEAPDADGRVSVIAAFQPGRDAPRALEALRLTPNALLPSINAVELRVNEAERALLESHPDVRQVEPNHTVHASRLTASLPAPGPWLSQVAEAPSEITWGLRMVQAPQIWDPDEDGVLDPDAPAGQGIKVCVLDSGVDRDHPEIEAMYAGGRDFVDGDDDPDDSTAFFSNDPVSTTGGGHGTHVQGTIAARYGHGAALLPGMHAGGVVGVAPRAEVITGRVLGVEGSGSMAGIISGLDWCVQQGAHVVNLSLGSSVNSTLEMQAVANATSAGALVVAAAGNDGTDQPHYPAAHPGAMAVAALTESKTRGSFSQRGSHISVSAPGQGILSSSVKGSGFYSVLTLSDDSTPEHIVVTKSGAGDYSGPLVDCGLSNSYSSCGEAATCGGFVALVSRGGLTFGEKVKFAMGQGAKAVVIINYDVAAPDADEPGYFELGDHPANIPVVSVGRTVGDAMRANLLGQEQRVGLFPVDYAYETGTSMATPHVAGVAALVWSAKPSLTNLQVRRLLECSAEYIGSNPAVRKNIGTGYGLVRAQAALDLLASWDADGWPATHCGE